MLPRNNLCLVALTIAQIWTPIYSFVAPTIIGNDGTTTPFFERQRSRPLSMACCSQSETTKKSEKVPITLLSGFLGAGKTTTLQHLLENVQGTKIGVIVNDVASINIDSKLITGKTEGVVELQNGCACCSLSNELFSSVNRLLSDRDFDALVVEMSGVADPTAIQSRWKSAKAEGDPVVDKAEIVRVVTLVDATTFGTDWMTWDLAGDRKQWVSESDDCGTIKKVPELLAEQIEAANVIVLNKKDLAGPEQLQVASSLVQSLNSKAKIIAVEYGRVQPSDLLQELAVKETSSCCGSSKSAKEEEPSSSRCSSAAKAEKESYEIESNCCDKAESTKESSCCGEVAAKKESSCCDNAETNQESSCCDTAKESTDSSGKSACIIADSDNKIGVTSFVYKVDRPFNTMKLLALLGQWPIPIKDDLDLSLLQEAQEGDYKVESRDQEDSPFLGVLRSKGFCWFAPTRWSGQNADVWRHDTVMYWSHAGKQFGITKAGKWWGTIRKEEMKELLDGDPEEYNRILEEDFVTEEFGDRRQEIVFIGIGMDEEKIRQSLDDCLMKNKGMKRYREYLSYMVDGNLADTNVV